MPETGDKWFWALAIACPTCAGGVLLAPFLAAGMSVAAAKGFLVLAAILALATVYVVWRWQQRRDACPLPEGSA